MFILVTHTPLIEQTYQDTEVQCLTLNWPGVMLVAVVMTKGQSLGIDPGCR